MAQKVNIILIDDIDGSDATETVQFGLDGVSYEIDLNDSHASALRDALATYIGHGRKVTSGGRRGAATARRSTGGGNTKAVRDWARANGYEVSDRGRISADIQQAYDAAH
jgi:hypothetical protein